MHSSSILASLGFVTLASALPTTTSSHLITRAASAPSISIDLSTEGSFSTKTSISISVFLTDNTYLTNSDTCFAYIRSETYNLDTHCIFETVDGLISDIQPTETEGVYSLEYPQEIHSITCRSGGEKMAPHTTAELLSPSRETAYVTIPNDGEEHSFDTKGLVNKVEGPDMEALHYCSFKRIDGTWIVPIYKEGFFSVPSAIWGYKCLSEEARNGEDSKLW
ncbi:hypothetical protein BGZ60DRAFT_434070 [Tricladium varicosporioides]|nr:hypothetical protein BGZ60DRAFT_434070 [Hymenoscyphus varicosporioides]